MSVMLRQPITDQWESAPPTADWATSYLRRLVYSDLLVVVCAVFGTQIAWVRVLSAMEGAPVPASGAQPNATAYSLAIVAAWMFLLWAFGSRDPRSVGTGLAEYGRVLSASLSTFGGLAIFVYLFDLQLARGYFLIALPAGLTALVLVRGAWRRWLCAQRRDGRFSSGVILVGTAVSVSHIARELARTPAAGYRVMGACVPWEQASSDDLGEEIRLVGEFDDLVPALEATGADTVVITSSDELTPQRVRELSWQLEPGRQHLIVAPSLIDIGGPRIHTRPVAGLPLIHVETPRYVGGRLLGKRLLDTIAAALLIALLSPLLLAVAVAVKLTSPGPVFFFQPRIGKNGRCFAMLKFRSMVPDAEERLAALRAEADAGNGVLFKLRDDPRVTPIGRVLRRYSIDELPQLFNVLRGHMSLVGPRPPLHSEVQEYERHVRRRFLVKPGITGPWQVGGRSNLSWEESVRLDLYYVENWTLTGDLIILFRTARAVLARDGAY
jgi:exopolysaccharide biosynthesis polyprenyl glycosylphosphotransferase